MRHIESKRLESVNVGKEQKNKVSEYSKTVCFPRLGGGSFSAREVISPKIDQHLFFFFINRKHSAIKKSTSQFRHLFMLAWLQQHLFDYLPVGEFTEKPFPVSCVMVEVGFESIQHSRHKGFEVSPLQNGEIESCCKLEHLVRSILHFLDFTRVLSS